jgi:alanine racemase
VTDLDFARALNQAGTEQGRPARFHLKVDTGMGRIGFLPEEMDAVLDRLAMMSGLDFEGIFTHFATSDEPGEAYVRTQFRRFADVLDLLRVRGQVPRLRHVCNSAATLRFPEMHLDAVRPGVLLYGMRPSESLSPGRAVRPVFRLVTKVALLRKMPAGTGLSYGLRYMTRGSERIAVLPVGYYDGYRRALSNRAEVLIRGQRAPVVGTICMDQMLVNVTGIEGVRAGDEVVLIGKQSAQEIPPEEIAGLLGTINYEIPGMFTPRVVRVYNGAGQGPEEKR